MQGVARFATLLAALVAAGVGLTGCGGGSNSAQTSGTTTSSHRTVPETQKEGAIGNVVPPPVHQPGEPADPDSLNKGGPDVSWAVRWLGNGRFALEITNTSAIGFVDQIDWKPPNGDRIESVGHSTAGSCSVANGRVSCNGLRLKPPTCLCKPGGSATVIFTMVTPNPRGGLVTGRMRILAMTPVPYIIPSAPGEAKSE
jgi:hypothetical protein